MFTTIKKLFQNEVILVISSIWGWVITVFFPNNVVPRAAVAVLIVMVLDLITKLFALVRQSGGIRCAFTTRAINSSKFAKGTLNKLIVFGVMLIISSCAYRITFVDELATWFAQVIFTIMFLRDVLSILENLSDAGIKELGLFKKLVRKKLDEYTKCNKEDKKK